MLFYLLYGRSEIVAQMYGSGLWNGRYEVPVSVSNAKKSLKIFMA